MSNEIAELVVTFFDETFQSMFTDPFCGEIDDFRTQRRVQRQIEEAAEVTSQALERFLLNEQIDPGTAEQMLKHLGRTLESGGVNAEWLAQPGLNPDSLAENLLADNPCPRHLVRQDLEGPYRLAMQATCLALTQVGPVMAEWRKTQFASTYEPPSKLLNRWQEISQRIDAIGKAGEGAADERFERTYLDYLLQRFSLIESGTVRMTTNLGIDLRTLFVPLQVRIRPASLPEEERQAAKEALMGLEAARRIFGERMPHEVSKKEEKEIEAVEAVREHLRSVIVGVPGSGKSTFLAWLQLALADGTESLNSGDRHWIPILLRLRELDARELPVPEEMILAATNNRELAGRRPGWLQDQLAKGRVVFMLDGLDEIDTAARDRYVLPWLKTLIDQYPCCRYVISSRPVGYPPGWLHDLDFVECDLLDFTPEQIGQYARQWCTAVLISQGEVESQARQEGQRTGDELLDRIQGNPYVRDLARNPLMLSAICLVQYFRHGELPNERALLYEWCVEGLLHHWDQRRGIRSQYALDEKLAVVRELALAMQSEGLAEYPADKVLDIFGEVLGDRERAAQLLEYIRYRSGLLIERRSGVFAFAHLTFQEYLAALAIEQGNRLGKDWQFLLQQREDDKWQEVIPLYCGLATEPNTRALICELVEQPPTERLGYLLAHGLLAAGRKLPAVERARALHCCARCPSPEPPMRSMLNLFRPDEVRKIANEELGKIRVRGVSNAYHRLRTNPSAINSQILLSTIPQLENLTPFGRGEVSYLITSCGPAELVSYMLSHGELLQLEGPNFREDVYYPTLAWVALYGGCERLTTRRPSPASASDISLGVKVLDAAIDAILAQPLPTNIPIPIWYVLTDLRPGVAERTSLDAQLDFAAIGDKVDRFARVLELQFGGRRLPDGARSDEAIACLRDLARVLRGA